MLRSIFFRPFLFLHFCCPGKCCNMVGLRSGRVMIETKKGVLKSLRAFQNPFFTGRNSLSQSLTALPAPSEREPLARPEALRFSRKVYRYAKGPIPEGAVERSETGGVSPGVLPGGRERLRDFAPCLSLFYAFYRERNSFDKTIFVTYTG